MFQVFRVGHAEPKQEVDGDEKPGYGCGETSVEKLDRRLFVVLDDEYDDDRHDGDEERGVPDALGGLHLRRDAGPANHHGIGFHACYST